MCRHFRSKDERTYTYNTIGKYGERLFESVLLGTQESCGRQGLDLQGREETIGVSNGVFGFARRASSGIRNQESTNGRKAKLETDETVQYNTKQLQFLHPSSFILHSVTVVEVELGRCLSLSLRELMAIVIITNS